MRMPEPLSLGDTIGIVAPASPFDAMALAQGMDLIQEMGFHGVMAEDGMCRDNYLAAPDAVRAAQINRYFGDESIQAILCARGGYGSSRILSLLDYPTLRRHPKIFMGFSDVTFLLNAIYKKCRMVTFHGPMAATLRHSDDASRERFARTLVSPAEPLSLEGCAVIRPGKAAGPIIGGNLTAMCHMMGTSFKPDASGCLLFLEDRGEALYRIDRMIVHLEQSGFLNKIRGVVLGTFEDCGPYDPIVALMADVCGKLKIPLVAGLASGHGTKNLALPIGLAATLDTEDAWIRFNPEVRDLKFEISDSKPQI